MMTTYYGRKKLTLKQNTAKMEKAVIFFLEEIEQKFKRI
jgi:hypothetical protein